MCVKPEAMKSAEAARRRFDLAAATWDDNPTRVALARGIAAAIRGAVPLRRGMTAMDFGAGTGLLTLALLPDVGAMTAVDASGGMLRVLDEKLSGLGVANVRTWPCDIMHDPLPPAPVDLIVSAMVLHHLPDVPQALRRLRACLNPGGWIALADLDAEDGSFHADATGVYHHGFDRAQLCAWLQAAGFTDAAAREAHRIARPSNTGEMREYGVFLVTARSA